ncbi:MAG: hypothetical protein Q9227_007436 [Pyrenula ochraceoflavens]
MGPPPDFSAPGTAAPPGMQQAQQPQAARGSFPSNFQPPANMPNINFSAPVIRLGTSGPGKPSTPMDGSRERDGGRRAGLGMGSADAQRQGGREPMVSLQPPTKEEIIRTIFVGGITEGTGGDEGVERILRAAGNLRRWTRAMDADNKPCKFGLAEYEDPESLSTAIEVLKDVEVPVKRQIPKTQENNDTDTDIEKSKLLFVADDHSVNYIQQWEEANGGKESAHAQMRLDHAQSALEAVLADLVNPSAPTQKDEMSGIDQDGDTTMTNGEGDGTSAEVVTIPITVDDELSDIPAEMRETVAKEIAAFRDRSNRRDMERLKREEEIEAMERARNSGPGVNRLASPPATAPSGPAGGANGIPIGPRDRSVPNAPAGPKAFGQQIPRDYQKGVSFVNGTGVNGAGGGWIDREDEDSEASDEELERRRKEKQEAELEKRYLDQERRWLNRERSRTAAVEREKIRDQEEAERADEEKEAMAKRLREWNDDTEASRRVEEYYQDRSMWIRNRASFRSREATHDDADRAAESRETNRANRSQAQAQGLADDFLARQAEEMDTETLNKGPLREQPQPQPQPPASRFKLSLGAAAAAQKAQSATAQLQRRTVAVREAEGLLEDEESSPSTQKRTLIPIPQSSLSSDPTNNPATTADLSEEERTTSIRQLASDIPTDKPGLWAWPVQWDFVDDSVITEQLKPFVEKKIVEYLGVQEQMLVDVVESHLRKKGNPQDLVVELEGALDEEAEVLVKKLWRMLIFFSESEKRGLSA